MELRELTSDMDGTYCVRTSSGTAYLICLDAPRHAIRLAADTAPLGDYADLGTIALRRDGEQIPLMAFESLVVGERAKLLLDVRGDGIVTVRRTTPVLSVAPLRKADHTV
jgi:hypothetical protein